MLHSDRVEERIEVLQADIAAVRNLSSSKKLEAAVDRLETDLDLFLDACKKKMRDRAEEAQNAEDLFDLRHRQLVGLAEEFSVLARRRPETSCKAFKARQVNLVLQPLKDEMEAYLKLPLCLVDEDGANSYSDVAVILRSYQDVSAAYVHRHYKGNPPVIPPVPANFAARLIQDQILMYCRDEPKSILQIGDMLGYKDKKTVRKYLNPLLNEGLLARTVPDRPNSRNQKYFTARPC